MDVLHRFESPPLPLRWRHLLVITTLGGLAASAVLFLLV